MHLSQHTLCTRKIELAPINYIVSFLYSFLMFHWKRNLYCTRICPQRPFLFFFWRPVVVVREPCYFFKTALFWAWFLQSFTWFVSLFSFHYWYPFPHFCMQISHPLAYGVCISSKASVTAGAIVLTHLPHQPSPQTGRLPHPLHLVDGLHHCHHLQEGHWLWQQIIDQWLGSH